LFYQGGLESVQSYLKAYARIFKQLKKEKSALITFEPGQMVQGKISNVTSSCAELNLESGIKGIISSYHYQGKSPLTEKYMYLFNFFQRNFIESRTRSERCSYLGGHGKQECATFNSTRYFEANSQGSK
jgi:hypothetical protein